MATKNQIKIYRKWAELKKRGLGMREIARRLGMSDSRVYKILERVAKGNPKRVTRCMEMARFACLWKHKYEARWLVGKGGRTAESVAWTRSLIEDMANDGFSINMISEYIKKDRSTILHHLRAIARKRKTNPQ